MYFTFVEYEYNDRLKLKQNKKKPRHAVFFFFHAW